MQLLWGEGVRVSGSKRVKEATCMSACRHGFFFFFY
jgi:hypothetical protein